MPLFYPFATSSPTWWPKITIPYTALQIGGLTNSAPLLVLPPKGVISAIYANVPTPFSGSGIISIVCTIGTSSANAKFMASVSIAAAGGINGVALTNPDIESLSVSTGINIYVTSVGANLSALTQGSIDIYLLTSILPS